MENRKMSMNQNDTNRQGQENQNRSEGRDNRGRFVQGSKEASRAGQLGGQHSQNQRKGNNQ